MARIGSAITLRQVPERYKMLEFKGRGATSIVYQSDKHEDEVFMLTRDSMKSDWLRHIDLAELRDYFSTSGHHIRQMDEYDVQVLSMPKLYKLNKENKRIVNNALKDYEKIYNKNNVFNKSNLTNEKIIVNFLSQENASEHLLYPLFNFLSDYDSRQYKMDLGIRNFLQDGNGKIVLIDPIVESDILKLMYDYHVSKRSSQNSFRV